jgi:hypothetical protein
MKASASTVSRVYVAERKPSRRLRKRLALLLMNALFSG